jgi:plasmid stability protein
MPTLTIKNIPVPLVKRLKTQATRHQRSLNLEVIACLETVAQSTPVDVDRLLADVRHLRPSLHHARLTNRLIDRFKTHGRP